MRIREVSGLVFAMLAVVGPATAQSVAESQERLLSQRAAEADAFRKLAEAVYGLQINADTYVKDFVTESDEIRGEVEAFVRGIRLGKPTWYDDGMCEVPAEVTVAKAVETLRGVYDRCYEGDRIKSGDFETITRRIDKRVIRVIGSGVPREDLVPGLPAGVAEVLGPPPVTSAGPPPVPEIWKRAGPRARLMALRAAELDAKRRLAERIKGLRLTSRTLVRDFAAESDVITTELKASLVGAREVVRYLHDDELIAEVTVRVPTEQVVESIKKLHDRYYKGDDVKGYDIERTVRRVVKRDFEATGMGVPPAKYLRRYVRGAASRAGSQVRMPEWVAERIEAEGVGTSVDIATAQGRLKAARAAELDARRKLADRIGGLVLESGGTVRALAEEHEELRPLVDALMLDAAVTGTRFTEQTAIVVVSIPGMRVWGVVNDALRKH